MNFHMKPPMWAPGIRQGHPLAVGLELCVPAVEAGGTTVRNLARPGEIGVFGAGASAPTWQCGPMGPIVDFDGGDGVTFETSRFAALDEPLTLAAIVRWDGNASYETIMSTRDAGGYTWDFRVYQGKLNLLTDAGSQASTLTLTSGEWCLAVAQPLPAAEAGMRFFLDAEMEQTGADRPITPGLEYLLLGCTAAGHFMDGAFAGWWIWSRALTAGEIAELYYDPWGLITPRRLF